jgi:hypothetical protein
MIAIASMCLIGLCLIIAWYTSRPMPVEDEQMILSRALNLPPERLSYHGVAGDEPVPGARSWMILPLGGDGKAVGHIWTIRSKVQNYTPYLSGDLVDECPFCTNAGPLTEEEAISEAKQIALRLWDLELADVEVRNVSTRPVQLARADEPRYRIRVELTFRGRGRNSPRSASFSFVQDSGVCYRVNAQFER